MIEKISLKVFWTAMLICAGTVIGIMWFLDEPSDMVGRFVATTFIIGLAAFLVWSPLVVYRFLAKL